MTQPNPGSPGQTPEPSESEQAERSDHTPAATGQGGAEPAGAAAEPQAPLPPPQEREPSPGAEVPIEISEEAVVALIAERDEYLDALQRMKAEFANARRRSDEQASTQRAQAAADLVTRLLPVLDSAQAALDQGIEQVRPLSDALFDVLAGQGLTRLDPVGEAFDPELHEAVMFEPGEADDPTQMVIETMRPGYAWNERVLRAAMVKVRG